MSILFDDARLGTSSPGRWTTGLWLSVALHAVAAIALIVVPIRASEKPSAPIKRSRMVFVLPPTQLVRLPAAPLVAPRLPPPAPPRPRPVRELVKAEPPKPLPVTPVVARIVEPPPAPLVPTIERPIEKPVIQRPPETGLFERTNAARTSQAAAAVAKLPRLTGEEKLSPRQKIYDRYFDVGRHGGSTASITFALGQVMAEISREMQLGSTLDEQEINRLLDGLAAVMEAASEC